MLQDCDIPVGAVKVVDQYPYVRGMIQRQNMAGVYSFMDVLLSVSRGEGFGVPIAEAQACGTPVIVGNWTSMPELVGAGWTVDKSVPFRDQDSYQFIPDVDGIVDALEKAYAQRGNEIIRQDARDFIVTNYDADMVTRDYWKPTLEMLETQVKNADKQAVKKSKKKGGKIKVYRPNGRQQAVDLAGQY